MPSLVVGGRRFSVLPVNMRIVRLIEESGYVGKPVAELKSAAAHAFMLDVVHASISRTARQRWWQVWRPRLSRAWLDEHMPAEDIAEAFALVCAATRRKGPAKGEGASP